MAYSTSRQRGVTLIPRGTISTEARSERVFLAGVQVKSRTLATGDIRRPLEDSLEELGQLAITAGARVVGKVTQLRKRAGHAYLGKGKLEELRAIRSTYDTVILDDELAPSQQRNLEQALGDGVKVIDRTALILDIFSRRAQTREGRLQVELAQHQYLLPRLAGQWSHLERLGGGIGTRGPGETQIETDRHLIGRRIQRLKKELDEVRKHRALYRSRRRSQSLPVVALVGYTNAGKSTLFNALTRAGVVVEAKLFSTLDPVTRRIYLPGGQRALLTDTVGVIHKLPPSLVAAFRATLEELEDASILLHVVDITHHNAVEQMKVVEDMLDGMGLEDKPMILALNKIDLVVSDGKSFDTERDLLLSERYHSGVFVSANKGLGLEGLLEEIDSTLMQAMSEVAFTNV